MQTQKPWTTGNLLSYSLHFPSAVPFQSHFNWRSKLFLSFLADLNCRLSLTQGLPATAQRQKFITLQFSLQPLFSPTPTLPIQSLLLTLKGYYCDFHYINKIQNLKKKGKKTNLSALSQNQRLLYETSINLIYF